jgi:hypothetical protein
MFVDTIPIPAARRRLPGRVQNAAAYPEIIAYRDIVKHLTRRIFVLLRGGVFFFRIFRVRNAVRLFFERS